MRGAPATPLRRDDGFTVIEALIAMAILAISAAALIGVSETQVARIDDLETRTIALWVAENRLVELELLGRSAAEGDGAVVDMLGRRYDVKVSFTKTSDPDLAEILVAVSEQGRAGPTGMLTGFVAAGAAQP